MTLADQLLQDIRARGPITVAAFMERALYDPAHGYYTAAARRSGRDGDFYTSVDVGPLFGELLAAFVGRQWHAWRAEAAPAEPFDVVEAGAGDGRLMRDVLDALAVDHPDCYGSARVHLVERSPAARECQIETLGPHAGRVASRSDALPARASGVLFSNELLDAFAVHRVTMTAAGLRELYVCARGDGLALEPGPPSCAAVVDYFASAGVELPRGAIADISPSAIAWVREAARRFGRGAMLFIDYGHEARDLFCGHHPDGTIASYARHQIDPVSRSVTADRRAWLEAPGSRDLTAHVDFTSVARAAEAEGWQRHPLVEQSWLLIELGLADRLADATGSSPADLRRRLAAKALAMPSGLGASHRALLLTRPVAGRRV